MIESLDNAKEELKRADHSIFVSLKYTRTVDMFKRIIERLISACEYVMDALLKYAKKKKRLQELPTFAGLKYEVITKLYANNKELLTYIEFYSFLKKINRATYTSSQEFRRHVTMTTVIDGKKFEIKIEHMYEYYEKTKAFVAYVEQLIQEK